MTLLDEALELSPSLALRPESFGALAYHFGNRKLTFLKQPQLVAVVQRMDGATPLRAVLAECDVPSEMWDVYAASVQRLMDSDMITRSRKVAT